MYLDAKERKAELMEQNKIQDGMMFKMNDDTRIYRELEPETRYNHLKLKPFGCYLLVKALNAVNLATQRISHPYLERNTKG